MQYSRLSLPVLSVLCLTFACDNEGRDDSADDDTLVIDEVAVEQVPNADPIAEEDLVDDELEVDEQSSDSEYVADNEQDASQSVAEQSESASEDLESGSEDEPATPVTVNSNAATWPDELTNVNGYTLPAGTRAVGFHVLCYDNAVSGLLGEPGVLSVIRSSHFDKPGARPDQVAARYDEVNIVYYDPELADIKKMLTTVRETDCPEAYLEEPEVTQLDGLTAVCQSETAVPGGLLFFSFDLEDGVGPMTLTAPDGLTFADGSEHWGLVEGHNTVPVQVSDTAVAEKPAADAITFGLQDADGNAQDYDTSFWIFEHNG